MARAERHDCELLQCLPSGECYLLFVFRMQCCLPVPNFQVQYRELLCSCQCVKGVVDPWEEKAALLCKVQSAIFHEKPKASVLLDEYYR
jgi:hypothetical protein